MFSIIAVAECIGATIPVPETRKLLLWECLVLDKIIMIP